MSILSRTMSGIAISGAMILFPTSANAQNIGVNAAVRNNVQMTTQANPNLHRAVVKERVSLGNDVITAANSMVQILLLDRTSFTVGANARMKIDRFVYDPNRKASAVGASVAKGAFRFMSGKALHANPGQSNIKTPVASIGIRGTIVEGVVGEDAIGIARNEAGLQQGYTADPQTASLIVLRGPGASAQGGETPGAIDVEAGGSTVSVATSGLAVFVPGPGQVPIGPFMLSDTGLEALQALLLTSPAKRSSLGMNPVVSNPIVDWYFEGEGDERSSIP